MGKRTEFDEMSNKIVDMVFENASKEELAAAIRHSMEVIDGMKEKHSFKEVNM